MRLTTIFFQTVMLGLILSTVFLACDKSDPKPSTFTVTFDTQSESKIDPQNVKSGQKATRPTDPTRLGHEFSGWYRDKAGTKVFDFTATTITANITLYARWVAIFTVTFDTQNGSKIDPQNVKSGQKATRPTDPTLQSYVFSGWYRDLEGTQVFDFTTATITANITLYARWVALFTVTFDTQSGTPAVPSQNVKSGQKATRPVADPTLQGYVFSGWYRDQAGTQVFDFTTATITADTTLYARWVATTFTVTFDTQSGTPAVPSQNVELGQKATRPVADPTLQGYVFSGWYRDQAGTQVFDFTTATITADTRLYVRWLVAIPDANFRKKLKAVVPNAFTGDLLDPRHNSVTGRTSLNLKNSFSIPSEEKITSLSGIGHFTALKTLFCNNNRLASLDMSSNPALTSLDCKNNALMTLNVSSNSKLTTLECDFNSLSALDMSSNPALKTLSCSNNTLGALDVSSNPALTTLICSNNTLRALNVSSNPALTTLNCRNNSLSSLNVSSNPVLTTLTCSNNRLSALDMSSNPVLTWLNCGTNSLTSLDLSGMRSVVSLIINATLGGKNRISTLKVYDAVKNHPQLREAKAARGSNITIKTYSAVAGLTSYTLTCADYDPTANNGAGSCTSVTSTFTITFFDMQGGTPTAPSQNVKLGQKATRPADPTLQGYEFSGWYRDQAGTQVFDFTTATITATIRLYAGWRVAIPDANFREKLKAVVPNAFTGDLLNPHHNAVTGLTALDVSSSSIISLSGIAHFTALKTLNCRNNPLETLDVSKNILLQSLNCSLNNLRNLDVSKNTNLTTLSCNNNPLGALDVSSNSYLTQLTCYNNSLQSLDVSANPLLTSLDCSNNNLTLLDLRGMRSVTELIIKATLGGKNRISTLRVHDAVKNHSQLREAKVARGSTITIKTYSAAAGSTSYTPMCVDYDPTANNGSCVTTARIFTVTFDMQGGGTPAAPSQIVNDNGKAAIPAVAPTRPGYVFSGWYRDQAVTQLFNFAKETITANITLYARWLGIIPDANFREKIKAVVPNAFTGDLLDPRHNSVTGLTALDVSSSSIISLSGIAHFTALKTLNCRNNPLENLDVSKNILLQSLNCSLNNLRNLDVSKNTKLTTLDCSINPLGSLDVSSNPELTQLTCYSNSLQSLDVSASPLLTSLDCSNNNLKLLDLRGMRSITELIIKVTLEGRNSIDTLRVHEALQTHATIKKAKDARANRIKVETYSAAAGSTSYTLTCRSYNSFTEQCIQNP